LSNEQLAQFDFHNATVCRMDISTLTSGAYFLKYKSCNTEGTIKFIKE